MKTPAEGSGRFDRVHGDEHITLDVERFMAKALEDVVETIMLHARFPAPSQIPAQPRRAEFDLREFISEAKDSDELLTYYVCSLTGTDGDTVRWGAAVALEKRLTEYLRDGPLVRARAEAMAEEDRVGS